MLKTYSSEDIRFFGTSSGGGQAMSLCVYIRQKHPDVSLPGKLVLQSPGLQVPPSEKQKAEMEKLKKDQKKNGIILKILQAYILKKKIYLIKKYMKKSKII